MRLTKIELNGFKSFANKTEIDIEKGITAIIGPNGSGKSNIADAVRWVLGEQSAKALRGAKMEDVIFNGTEQRKPQAYCQVTLTFDNADGGLPTEFAEVSVTRRVFRNGESEYLINRTPCRLRDIQNLFRDTGIGKDGYSIIGQGKVEEILSNKSGDRRAAFEEAAGIMKYRVRKEEAERKLENTKKNLVRIQDILEELRAQLGPLEEQNAVAQEYLRLRDSLRDIEVSLFLSQYDKLQERLQSLEAGISQLDEGIATANSLFEKLAKDCILEEEKERKLGASISEMQASLLNMSSGAESRAGSIKVIQERMGNLERERVRMETERESQEQQAAELRRQLAEAAAGAEAALAAEAQSSVLLEKAEAEREALEREIQQKESQAEKQKNEMIAAMNRLSDAKSRISRLETIRGTLTERIAEAELRQRENQQEGEKLQEEYKSLEAHCRQLEEDLGEQRAQREKLAQEAEHVQQQIRSGQAGLHQQEQQMEAARSRTRVLQEMKRAHEGYYASIRNLMRDASRDRTLGQKIEGLVAELIQVPREYEAAIEMAMGSALQNVVTPTEQDAKQVIEYLHSKQYGRATFLPVSVIRPRLLSQQELAHCQVEGFLGVASELIRFSERYRGIMENLLGRTVIVRDLNAGIAINRNARSAFRIATLKGDIINPGGSMTGGSTQKREFSLIGREREIQEQEEKLLRMAAEMEAQSAKLKALEGRQQEAARALEEAEQACHDRELALAGQREKLESLHQYVVDNQQARAQREMELSQLQDNMEDIRSQWEEAHRDQSSLEADSVSSQADIRRMQEEISTLRSQYSQLNDRVTEQKIDRMSRKKEAQAIQETKVRLTKEAASLENRMEEARRAIAQSAQTLLKLKEELETLTAGLDVERKDIDALTDQIHLLEEERAGCLRALDESREKKEKAADELAELRERRHKFELNQNRAQLELTNAQDRIWNDYSLTYESAQQYRRPIAAAAGHLEVDSLKQRIRALGDVNVNAIADYRNLKERLDSLEAQYEDLQAAEKDLRTLIQELVEMMEQAFQQQFRRIQQNFSSIFAELFGGGRAELVLSDPKDILNCDIDIIAQPPGKKLQLLSLLSGGERALTAIALLFAILKLKPAAFCILDEIEAALDEANVSNFATFVRNYAQNTQFILITHRKGSMEVCDSLYGVAMEEKGVSKVVSARFTA